MLLDKAVKTKTQGAIAEDFACRYLIQQGLFLLTKNFRCKWGEIDLIMHENKKTIIFIEVRSRSHQSFGLPFESINRKKIQKIIKTADFYLQSNYLTHKISARFDVISLQPIQKDWKIQWIKNAFIT